MAWEYDGARLWHSYYSDARVIWEMLRPPALRYRELAFVFREGPEGYRKRAFRGRVAIKPRALRHWLKKFLCREDFRRIPCDVFMGIRRARRGYGPSSRAVIPPNRLEYWGYDVVIEIDGTGPTREQQLESAYEAARRIKEILDTLEAPYALVFSGGRGFHIWFLWEHLRAFFTEEAWPGVFRLSLVPWLAGEAGVPMNVIDTSQFAPHGLIRVWYSVHPLTGLVCLPLTDAQFDNFTPDLALPHRVLALPRLGQRGPLVRSQDRSLEPLVLRWLRGAPPWLRPSAREVPLISQASR